MNKKRTFDPDNDEFNDQAPEVVREDDSTIPEEEDFSDDGMEEVLDGINPDTAAEQTVKEDKIFGMKKPVFIYAMHHG